MQGLPHLVLQVGEGFQWALCCKLHEKPRFCCLTKPGKDPSCCGQVLANGILEDPSLRSHRTSAYAQSKTLSRTAVQCSMFFAARDAGYQGLYDWKWVPLCACRKPIRTCRSCSSKCACYDYDSRLSVLLTVGHSIPRLSDRPPLNETTLPLTT